MSMRSKTFSAGRWSIASSAARTMLQILQMSILARLLVPSDFGLMAIAGSVLAVTGLFTDLGLSRAIIHFEHIPEDALSSLYWLNLLAGLLLTVLFAAVAPALALLYQRPDLEWVLISLSPFFLLNAIGQQFCALAEKELRFSKLASNEMVATLLGLLGALAAAWFGAGVYALVVSFLVTALVNSLLAVTRLSEGHRPAFHVNMREARKFLAYGGYLIADNFTNMVVRQADIFVGGVVARPALLGMYSVPRDLSLKVSTVINPIITRVSFPVMSRMQGDRDSLASVYAKTLRLTASINFPAYVLLGLYAREIVALLYGQQWHDAATYLRVLAIWGVFRSLTNPVGSLLYAVGKARRALIWNLILLVTLPMLFWAAARTHGLMGLAYMLAGSQVILMLPIWKYLVQPCSGLRCWTYMRQMLTPLILSLAAGGVAWFVTRHVPHGTLRLALGGLAGGLTYLSLSWVFNRAWADVMLELVTHRKRPDHV